MMVRLLQAELPKQRRTFTPWLLLIGPSTVVLIFCIARLVSGEPMPWEKLLAYLGTYWGAIWVPFGATLLAALAVAPEARGGAWRALRARPVPPAGLFVAKAVTVMLEGALASALLFVLLATVGTLIAGAGEPIPWLKLSLLGLLPFIGALPVLALHLWLATGKGFAPTFVVGVGGFIAGMLAQALDQWMPVPWSYPERALRPLLQFQQAGVDLTVQEALAVVQAAAPVIGLSLVLAVALVAAGAVWFSRCEVK